MNWQIWPDSTQPYNSQDEQRREAYSRIGLKGYEVSNHLGNVQVVVSDKRFIKANGSGVVVPGYLPALAAAYDYYPYGMLMPDRFVRDLSVQTAWVNQVSKVPVAVETSLQPITSGWSANLASYSAFSHARPNGMGGNITGLQISWGPSGARTLPGFVYHALPTIPGAQMNVRAVFYTPRNSAISNYIRVEEQVSGGGWQQIGASTLTYMMSGRPDQTYLDFSFVAGSGAVRFVVPMLSTYPSHVLDSLYYSGYRMEDQATLVEVSNKRAADGYRYGFNGQMKDNDVAGVGNHLDFGARGYDPRLGRWWSIDPKASKYPGMSPYNFTGNNPILFVDYDGKDFGVKINHDAKTIILVQNVYTVSQNAYSQALKGAEQWNNKVTEVGGYKVSFQVNVIQPYQTTRQEVASANPPDLYKKNGRVNNNVMEKSQQDRNTYKGEANAQKDPIGNLYYGNIGVDSRTVNGESFVGGYTRDGKAISMNNHHTYADQQSFGDMGSYADLVSHEIGHTFGLDHPAGGVMEYGGVNLKPISDNDVSEIIRYTNDRLTNGNGSGAKVKMMESVGKPNASSPVQH